MIGYAQIGHRETGQCCHRTRTATSGRLVTNFTAGAGGRTRIGRNGGRVIVGFDLDLDMDSALFEAVDRVIGARNQHLPSKPLDDRGVVVIGDQRALRRGRMSQSNQLEQGVLARLAIDRPAGVENLVPAMFRVGLGKHHQLGVGRITPQVAVGSDQVVDLAITQGQAQLAIDPGQGRGR
jgi:hypothetical protein